MRAPKNETLGVALLVAGLAALLLLIPNLLGAASLAPLRIAFGWGAYAVVASLWAGGAALVLAGRRGWNVRWAAIALAELLFFTFLVLMHLASGRSLESALAGWGGGLVGWAGSSLLAELAGPAGAWGIAAAAAAVLAGLLAWRLPGPRYALSARARTLLGRARRWLAGAQYPGAGLSRWPGRALRWLRGVWRGLWPAPTGAGETDAAASGRSAAATESRRARSRAADASGKGGRDAGTRPAGSQPSGVARPDRSTPAGGSRGARPAGGSAARGERARPRPENLPPLDLLRPDAGMPSGTPDVRLRAQVLKQTLAEFGVPVEVVSIKEGPTVTQFGLEPGELVRELRNGEVQRRRVAVHSIVRLSNDLALALAAPSIRIEAPVPGRPYVGVEVPNAAKTLVSLRGVLESKEFMRMASPLAAALGRDVSGDPVVIDLDVLPHLLIAGATGSGKSVCINALVCSLLMSHGPETVRFIMVDPKMVELPVYNGIPHLVGPVITDPAQVPGALAWLTLQMDERYRLFADQGVRNIGGYNRKAARSRRMELLPYILLVVDELADLMMSTAYDIERQICRLAQLSRATGIHLILATQRPSVDVITGLIKANFPARIAFAVTTQVDSRVILDAPGAEKLLGRGDMLYMAPDSAKLVRIQGCFVSDREIDAIVDFWKASAGTQDMPDLATAPWAGMGGPSDERDELLEEALALLRTKASVSTSLLQRQLRIGFPRAARLMEQLEAMGVVGPDEGGGRSRRVLMSDAGGIDALD